MTFVMLRVVWNLTDLRVVCHRNRNTPRGVSDVLTSILLPSWQTFLLLFHWQRYYMHKYRSFGIDSISKPVRHVLTVTTIGIFWTYLLLFYQSFVMPLPYLCHCMNRACRKGHSYSSIFTECYLQTLLELQWGCSYRRYNFYAKR